MTAVTEKIADSAILLATGPDRDTAIAELINLAGQDRAVLATARDELAMRLQQRSDDFAATGGLRLVNAALATMGWQGQYAWGDRKKRFSRQRTD